MNTDTWDTIIYIDGKARRVACGLTPVFFVDSDELPRRRCSQHTMSSTAIQYLKDGEAIQTNGHRYCLTAPWGGA